MSQLNVHSSARLARKSQIVEMCASAVRHSARLERRFGEHYVFKKPGLSVRLERPFDEINKCVKVAVAYKQEAVFHRDVGARLTFDHFCGKPYITTGDARRVRRPSGFTASSQRKRR
jgi:hypothetical protein